MFDINKTLQRCLVKAIAMCGLGLDIFTKEDNPLDPSDVIRRNWMLRKDAQNRRRRKKSRRPWDNHRIVCPGEKSHSSDEVNKWLGQYWADAMGFFKKGYIDPEKEIKSFRDGLKATEELQTKLEMFRGGRYEFPELLVYVHLVVVFSASLHGLAG